MFFSDLVNLSVMYSLICTWNSTICIKKAPHNFKAIAQNYTCLTILCSFKNVLKLLLTYQIEVIMSPTTVPVMLSFVFGSANI